MSESPETEPQPHVAHSLGNQSLPGLIARNSALSVLGRASYIIGWTLVAPFMLARLGADRFGLWSLLSVVSGLYLTFDLGLSSALTKFVAEFRAQGDRAGLRAVYSMAWILYGTLSLAFLCAIAAGRELLLNFFHIAPALRAEARSALLAAAVVAGVTNFYMMLSSVLNGLQRLDTWNRIAMAITLLQLAGVWLVLSAGGGLVALMVNAGIMSLLGLWLCRRSIRKLAPEIGIDSSRFDPGLIRRMTTYSLALQIINLGVLFQFQLEKVLFGSLLTLPAVASYELGLRLASALWAAPLLLLSPVLAAVAHLEATGDRDRIVRLYRRASRYVLAVAMSVSAGIIALAPLVFVAWLGPGHGDAALAAQALAAMLAVSILTGVGTAVARGLGRPEMEVRYQLLSMVIHLGLGLTLIPRLGFAGGLWALCLSSSVGCLYFVWVFHRFLKEPVIPFFSETLARPVLAAALAGGLAWWVTGAGGAVQQSWGRLEALGHLGVGLLVFVPVVVGLLVASRHVSWDELRDLLRLAMSRSQPTTARRAG